VRSSAARHSFRRSFGRRTPYIGIGGIPGARAEEYADNVAQVVQLVLGGEFIVQVERTEDHVDLRHVQAGRNSHTRFHQWYQSMSGLLAGRFEDSVFGLDNCSGII